jgi:hypothetical protein
MLPLVEQGIGRCWPAVPRGGENGDCSSCHPKGNRTGAHASSMPPSHLLTPPVIMQFWRLIHSEQARRSGTDGYRAISVARDSRTTVTRIWPG